MSKNDIGLDFLQQKDEYKKEIAMLENNPKGKENAKYN